MEGLHIVKKILPIPLNMSENIRENLRIQLDELESLQAMFYNPGEIKIENLEVFQYIKDFVCGRTKIVPPCLGYSVNVPIEDDKFEVCISLPSDYPANAPDMFVRNQNLNKTQHVELNKRMENFLTDLPRGEPCIFSAISWLQDQAQSYCKPEIVETCCPPRDEELVRFWIYSHHIYSKTKRNSLINLAHNLNVTGFVMPGKPGIICVEGCKCDVNEWWQTVKSMNWKKIFCKITESNKEDLKNSEFLKFKDFAEQVFENHGPKFNHMDMGEFYKYLEEHQLGYIFKDIFGVDAKGT